MPHVDGDLRSLLDSDDPRLDRELGRLARATVLWILWLVVVIVIFAVWVTR